jgi:D-methionine transport system permease protein
MSLLKYSLWDVINGSFNPEIWFGELGILQAALDTLYMVSLSALLTLILGLILGASLYVTDKNGIWFFPWFNLPANALVNFMRSLPDVIMIILLIPFARAVFGHSYGANSFIVTLSAIAIPFFSRVVESALKETSKGKIEAAKSMGCGNTRLLFQVIVPECLPTIIRGLNVAIIVIISLSALAGNFGAGGLGDIAVRFGYQRFQHDKLFAAIYVIIALVWAVQFICDSISRHILRKRNLI